MYLYQKYAISTRTDRHSGDAGLQMAIFRASSAQRTFEYAALRVTQNHHFPLSLTELPAMIGPVA